MQIATHVKNNVPRPRSHKPNPSTKSRTRLRHEFIVFVLLRVVNLLLKRGGQGGSVHGNSLMMASNSYPFMLETVIQRPQVKGTVAR